MDKDTFYQQQLFKKLSQGPDLQQERELLANLFGQAILNIVDLSGIKGNSALPKENLFCSSLKRDERLACLGCLGRVINSAKKSQGREEFICPGHFSGFCLPLVQGDACYGFLILCHLKTKPALESIRLWETLNRTILEKAQKELELTKLYQTIRPRAIALSTIHTIRRLLSSSLNLDELLPRIARLSLQILRAKRCLISLVDKKNKHLVPKSVIDISKKKVKPHLNAAMRAIQNKTRRSANTILAKSYLSIPLIDEDPIGVITVFDKMNGRPFDDFDREILTALSEQAVGAIKNAQLYGEQENILFGTVQSLSALLKAKTADFYAHSPVFFVDIVLGIAQKLGLSEEKRRDLRFAAMLHDAEKISIPEQILQKPTHLTGKEFRIVKEHPQKSAEILRPLEHLKPAIAIILHHHEKFDGTGYPDKLKADQIPLGARIMAVADSFQAMISRRPYRQSTSIPEAIEEIKRQSGTQFDPQVIKAFLLFTKEWSFKKLIKRFYHGRAKKDL